ncbi:MAG: hypothetical protein H6560_15975 [Lewinellaceae bacterium]|nr:hypothetical protein [Lewinellaceae bacterium]
MLRLIPVLTLLFALPAIFNAQDTPSANDREATLFFRQQGPKLQFGSELPPHIQIPGAPEAYYEYYWEFGDGAFSFEEEPVHLYIEPGAYDVQLWATGKYDNGKSPRSRRKRVEIKKDTTAMMAAAESLPQVLPDEKATLAMQAVRNPRPGEEFVAIISYRNPEEVFSAGQLHLFFNESKFDRPQFEFREARTPFGEYEVEPAAFTWNPGIVGIESWVSLEPAPGMWRATTSPPAADPREWIAKARAAFHSEKAWRFDNMEPGAVHNLFISLNPTPAMAADTNVTLHLRAVYMPDAGGAAGVYDLTIPVVASHDPNFIAVSDRRAGFRNLHRKKLEYEVHFQNNGEGPAKRIQITTTIPEGLDVEAMEILETQPACPICPKTSVDYGCMDTTIQDGKIFFTFYNIYLPGSRQEGVSKRDSTKGFVRYRMAPSRKAKKLPLRSRASIVFDRNEPVITNFSTTRFKPGFSPGPVLGYRLVPEMSDANAFVAGVAVAPYKPYRPYFQVEFLAGFTGEWADEVNVPRDTIRTEVAAEPAGFPVLLRTDSIFQSRSRGLRRLSTFQLAPLHVRYNINDFIGLGAGASLTLSREKWARNFDEQYGVREYWCPPDGPGEPCELIDERAGRNLGVESGVSIRLRLGLFADVQLGLVRAGPALGIRPSYQLGEDDPFSLLFYLSYKF